jgi:hypothetical protein
VNIGYTIRAVPNSVHHTHFAGWVDGNDQSYPDPLTANLNPLLHFTIPTTNGLVLKAKFQ